MTYADTIEAGLATRFRRLIRRYGPMTVSRYMGESNAQYYAQRDPLGATGDFVTAPEVSQMFGEFIGLWLADLWQRAGTPADAIYVELGPGRGTLARDALRTMARFGLKPDVHLVEASPALRSIQHKALGRACFHDTIDSVPQDRPLLLVANEFFDALPIDQLVKTIGGWRERMIALEDDAFVFCAGLRPVDAIVPDVFGRDPPGTVIETSPAAAAIMREIATRVAATGGAAVTIDYGHLQPRTGSTLQAVKAHEKLDALALPGEADLTAHVDFPTLGAIARQQGTRVQTATQGRWLSRLGLDLRVEALVQAAPDQAPALKAARDRLIATDQMGELFKVMAVTGGGWPEGAGFEDDR